MHGRLPPTTPAGLQSLADLAGRRRLVAFFNIGIFAAFLFWVASILNHDGWSVINAAIFVAVAIAAPWSVLGFCNAALGLWLLHFHRDGMWQVAPFARAGETGALLQTRTAILLTIRNEDANRAFSRLRAVKTSVDAAGQGASFHWFVLSDSSDPRIAKEEEREFARWRDESGACGDRLHYRRRRENIGYKAGNMRDFCERWSAQYEFMIPLDADSLMDGATILKLVRIGEAYPKIGILQSLVVGAPSKSAFARIFQFGMRHGMRTYTMGAAWWAGDCGPFWGHNALVRVEPFARHCVLPKLGGDQHILSHDQIEAALMRCAGYEVRVLPIESGSYEENPPTLLDFVRRDLRWCQGNMQYLNLLKTPGLLPMSRFQLIWAVSMFIGAPAWTTIIALAAVKPAFEDLSSFPKASAAAVYLLFLLFYLAPKLAGFADAALTPGGLARYGGAGLFFAGALTEIIGSFLIGAVTTLNVSIFLVGLLFDRTIGWRTQSRDVHGVLPLDALRALWPHLLFGAAVMSLAGATSPTLLLWSLPLTFGYIGAIPFTLASASPKVGVWFMRAGLCAAPEEFDKPEILRTLGRQKSLENSTAGLALKDEGAG